MTSIFSTFQHTSLKYSNVILESDFLPTQTEVPVQPDSCLNFSLGYKT